MSWYSERLRAFNAQHAINGTTFDFDGAEVDALCPQKDQFREMKESDFIGRREAAFTIRRTDYQRLSIEVQDELTSVGTKFQVASILDDDAEPTVDLRCRYLQ